MDYFQGLSGDVEDLAAQYNNTLTLAKDSLDEARETKTEALSIHTEASSIGIPEVNDTVYKEEAKVIMDEAINIKKEVERLMTKHAGLLSDIDNQIIQTRELVKRGQIQQQLTAELLANVFAANKEAQAAVEKADKTLEEAEKTYKTLKGIDFLVYIK